MKVRQTHYSVINTSRPFVLIFIIVFILSFCKNKTNNDSDYDRTQDTTKVLSNWTKSQKNELINEMIPLMKTYGELGEEFCYIYINKICTQFSYNEALRQPAETFNKLFNESLEETSPGWSLEAKINLITACKKTAIQNGMKEKIADEYCNCVMEEIVKEYKNPLISDIKSQKDTIIQTIKSGCLAKVVLNHKDEFFNLLKNSAEYDK